MRLDDRTQRRWYDALIQTHIFHYVVEERVCWIAPETGQWEEIQSVNEPHEDDTERRREHKALRLADDLALARAGKPGFAIQPCYQAEGQSWRVVPFYMDDVAAACLVMKRVLCFDQAFELRVTHTGRLHYAAVFESGDGSVVRGSAYGDSEAAAICLAALRALGVEVIDCI